MRAKKSLGQNFLNSQAVARDIVKTASLSNTDTVLEIGPGKGFLTGALLATGAHIVAIEKDDRMIPFLKEKFSSEIESGLFTLIHGDVIEILEKQELSLPAGYKLIANIPYYITGLILRTFLELENKPSQMVLMVQKEVADRIVARDHKESLLSLSVKVYGTPKLIKKVPARYFTPAPKVDSAVLEIKNISGGNFETKIEENRFFEIIKAGFAHKRKKLSGNLAKIFEKETKERLIAANIDPDARAENLSLENWIHLSKKAV